MSTQKRPRFSWQFTSDLRNVAQTAYEIAVTDEAQKSVWSSGKVESDQSVFVPYGGPALKSGAKYNWKVRVWDNNKKGSAWSQGALWQMGLLEKADWKAKWIEADFAEDTVNQPSPLFRKDFRTSKKIRSATAFITAHGMYEAEINGKRVGDYYLTPGWTSYNKRLQYQVYDVTKLLQSVTMRLVWQSGMAGTGDSWPAGQKKFYGKTLALLFQLQLTYNDGRTDFVVSDNSWKSSPGQFRIQKSIMAKQ